MTARMNIEVPFQKLFQTETHTIPVGCLMCEKKRNVDFEFSLHHDHDNKDSCFLVIRSSLVCLLHGLRVSVVKTNEEIGLVSQTSATGPIYRFFARIPLAEILAFIKVSAELPLLIDCCMSCDETRASTKLEFTNADSCGYGPFHLEILGGSLFRETLGTDFDVTVGNRVFHAHRLVLAETSSTLREIVYRKNPVRNFLKLPTSSVPAGEMFLRWIYGGTNDPRIEAYNDLSMECTLDLMRLLNHFGVGGGLEFMCRLCSDNHLDCKDVDETGLDADEVSWLLHLLKIADECRIAGLFAECVHVVHVYNSALARSSTWREMRKANQDFNMVALKALEAAMSFRDRIEDAMEEDKQGNGAMDHEQVDEKER